MIKLLFDTTPDEVIGTEYANNQIIESLNIPTAKCFDMITYNQRKGLILQKLEGLLLIKTMQN